MANESRKTAMKDETTSPEIALQKEPSRGPVATRQQVEGYLLRKAEVTKDDRQAFQDYLNQKEQAKAHVAQKTETPAKPEAQPGGSKPASKFNRRNLLKAVAGTAIAGEAVSTGYSWVSSIPNQGAQHAGSRYTEAQRHNIERTLIDSKSDIGGRSLGRYIALLPTKMGGGTYALDLNTNRVLSSIWYWNYGDYNPISHHLCAFPSADPYNSFEFVNSTQGGKNCLIYGINTRMGEPEPGFNIYHVRYDGQQMDVMENVSEATGLGLGVHVTVNPGDAQSFFVTDGQKDIAACFDRSTSTVIAALKYDWEGNSKSLRDCWMSGGKLKISKIYPDAKTGKFDYLGTKGQKIEWEMVPMGELFVEEGTIPGDSPHTLSGADGTIWHPTGRWAATVIRLCGGICILDAENNFNPVAFLQFNKDSQDQYPVKGIDADHWEVVFDKIHSPGHEIGFSPDGRFLCMMNNLRENSCAVFDSSDPDPTRWKKIAHVEDPLWGGKYPNPFHMVFSIDSSKLYLSVLHPSPAASGIMVVDTGSWKIIKEIQGIGPDLQTPAITYDGKYVLCPFSGFQRLSSGIAVVSTETDDLIGILPSNGGHHDCVIIPGKLDDMKHTRSCTL
jgi:thiocyanate desulfurase